MQLIQHSFCPHSRFIRLALGEYSLTAELVDEPVWERRAEFLALNPAGTTPVLIDGGVNVCGASAIAEYIDEKFGVGVEAMRLLPSGLEERAEVRRLTGWFNDKFFAEVSDYLVGEKIVKRNLPAANGGGAPDSTALRAARANIGYHLNYIGWLLKTRNWLAGNRITYADIAAAAHLSAADYLGDVPWNENEAAKQWYARMKSRPSFRPMLAESLPGLAPSATYANLDF
jgi:glutathione S-transferase